jgi:hypothetical protein
MGRAPSTFRQREVTRALKAIAKSGVAARLEIDKSGKITIIPTDGSPGTHDGRDEVASSQGWHGLSPPRAAGFPHPQPSTEGLAGPWANPESF